MGRDFDNEYVLRSMMWADGFRLICHNREILVHFVNDHRRTAELGNGTQAGITMVDELVRGGGGPAHAQGGEEEGKIGICRSCRSSRYWSTFST